MTFTSTQQRTVTGKFCRECGRPKNGPTAELLAWAKRVGREEALREMAQQKQEAGK